MRNYRLMSPMKITASAGILAVALLATAAATNPLNAMTISNRGTTSQELTIDDGKNVANLVIKPNETIKDVCQSGCSIKLSSGDEGEFEGTEIVQFDDEGFIYQN